MKWNEKIQISEETGINFLKIMSIVNTILFIISLFIYLIHVKINDISFFDVGIYLIAYIASLPKVILFEYENNKWSSESEGNRIGHFIIAPVVISIFFILKGILRII